MALGALDRGRVGEMQWALKAWKCLSPWLHFLKLEGANLTQKGPKCFDLEWINLLAELAFSGPQRRGKARNLRQEVNLFPVQLHSVDVNYKATRYTNLSGENVTL